MLTVGIAIMVTSVVVGVVALTLVAVTSSTARSTGRSIRFAMALSDEPERTTPSYDRPRGGAISNEQDARYQPAYEQDAPFGPAEEQDAPYQPAEEQESYYLAEEEPGPLAAEIQDAPRWVVVMTIVSGAGLVLGMLMVMVASIT